MARTRWSQASGSAALTRWLMAWAMAAGACAPVDDGLQVGSATPLEVSPPSLVFSDLGAGASVNQVLVVRHTGPHGEVRLDEIIVLGGHGDVEVVDVDRTLLRPGDRAQIVVRYAPSWQVPTAETLWVVHDLPGHDALQVPVSTPGLRPRLQASPASLSFGVVAGGEPRTLDLRILNTGSAPATLTEASVSSSSSDFRVTMAPGAEVVAGGEAMIQVTYQPSGGDVDAGILNVRTSREDVLLEVPLHGEEESPRLVVDPTILWFGWLEPGRVAELAVDLFNGGNAPLHVTEVAVLADPSLTSALSLVGGAPGAPLAPGASTRVHVHFAPLVEIPWQLQPLGALAIQTNDPLRPLVKVPVHGAAGRPALEVTPSWILDLGFVATGETGHGVVTLKNVGDASVAVADVALAAPTDPGLTLELSAAALTLAPGEEAALAVHFHHDAPGDALVTGRVYFTSDDPLVPAYEVTVVARRSPVAKCEPGLAPGLLALGAALPGDGLSGVMTLRNTGSGSCVYQGFDFVYCDAIQEAPDTWFICDGDFTDNPFSIIYAPPAGAVIGPGESLAFGVGFTAPPLSTFELGRESHYGRIVAQVFDPSPSGGLMDVTSGQGWTNSVNLRAESAEPAVDVAPATVDFGVLKAGCASSTMRTVRVQNRGPLEVTLMDLWLEGCPGPLQLEGVPPLPYTLVGFEQLAFTLSASPDGAGVLDCALKAALHSETTVTHGVEVVGLAVDQDHHEDVFIQDAPHKLDLLFVMDDSGSMVEEQVILKNVLPELVEEAISWGQDVRLAVTTTDTAWVKGAFLGEPPWLTSADAEAFAARLLVESTASVQSHKERGLEASWLALSGVNVLATDVPCEPAPGACPDGQLCVDGACQGRNFGFLRDDAHLVVFVLSDEDDVSDGPASLWAQRLAGLKQPWDGVGVTLHAVVRPVDDAGCGALEGAPGARYVAAAAMLDGHVESICAEELGSSYDAVGAHTFGLTDRFFPTMPVDPVSLEVHVDGTKCAEGWHFNPTVGAVVFDPEGSCFPGPGASVHVAYALSCQ